MYVNAVQKAQVQTPMKRATVIVLKRPDTAGESGSSEMLACIMWNILNIHCHIAPKTCLTYCPVAAATCRILNLILLAIGVDCLRITDACLSGRCG